MTLTLKSFVEDRVPAWVECDPCQGEGFFIEGSIPGNIEQIMCDDCNGAGGAWHEAVEVCGRFHWPLEKPMTHAHIDGTNYPVVTKSSYLVRKWTCPDHLGTKKDLKLCDKCTASKWEVE